VVENRTKYANKIHELLSDHGITEYVKSLNKDGREFLRELSLPTPWSALLESSLELIETLNEEIRNLEASRLQTQQFAPVTMSIYAASMSG